jgi:L-serine deaminase
VSSPTNSVTADFKASPSTTSNTNNEEEEEEEDALKSAVTEVVGELTKEPCVGLRHVSANVQKRAPQILDNASSVQQVEKEVINAFEYDAKYVLEDAKNIAKTADERVEKLSQALEDCIKSLESD